MKQSKLTKGSRAKTAARASVKASRTSTGSRVQAPAAVSQPVSRRRDPAFRSTGACTTVTNSELVSLVARNPGSAAFRVFSYAAQPASISSFPWLSAIAARYETYRFRKLSYQFSPRLPSIAPGTAGIAFDHDPLDAPPSSMVMAMSYHDRLADSVWRPWSFSVDLSRSAAPFYFTRVESSPGDQKTYDVGTAHFFLEGIESDSTAGMLEVSYTIDLFTPQLDSGPLNVGTIRATPLATDNLVNNLVQGAGSAVPVEQIGKAIRLVKDFEGIVSGNLAGGGLDGHMELQPQKAPGMAEPIVTTLHEAAGEVEHVASWAVKLTKGAILTPTYFPNVTVPVLNSFDMDWSLGPQSIYY